jgi:hypothetical protein
MLLVVVLVIFRQHGRTRLYRRLALVIGGVLMDGLGLLLIFFPDVLFF